LAWPWAAVVKPAAVSDQSLLQTAFDEAWNVPRNACLLARFTNDSELKAELSQRLVVLASDDVTAAEELRRQVLASFPLAKWRTGTEIKVGKNGL
jgi:hypothetical protein